MQNKISVDMGDYKTTSKGDLLQTIGLGSCVATCLYDSEQKCRLSHILAAKSYETYGNPRKFADKAIDLMLAEMVRMGAKKERVKQRFWWCKYFLICLR
jgi:chemotaxis protein CheD